MAGDNAVAYHVMVETETCRCRDPWNAHEAFRWTPPADGAEHVIVELRRG